MARPSESTGLAAELGLLLAQARRLTWARASQRLEARGHSIYAWQLLNHLRRLGPSSQRELASSAAQHPAGVSRLLDELEQRGWVARRRARDDRRCVTVALTARGRTALAQMQPEVEAGAEEALDAKLGRADQHALRALLLKLFDVH